MKRSLIPFLQIGIVLIGIVVLIFMLWEPHLEGRNVDATTFEIYFKDPFLAYVYLSSIAFFIALYQAFKFLGYVGQNEVHSERSIKALRTIKYCAISLVAFILGAEGYLGMVQRKVEEDTAGAVMLGLIMMLISGAVAAFAAVFERRLQKGVNY